MCSLTHWSCSNDMVLEYTGQKVTGLLSAHKWVHGAHIISLISISDRQCEHLRYLTFKAFVMYASIKDVAGCQLTTA